MQPLMWSPETRAAFQDLRMAICTDTVLYAPLPNRPFRLYADASNVGLGAVLTQETPTGEHPVFFLS